MVTSSNKGKAQDPTTSSSSPTAIRIAVIATLIVLAAIYFMIQATRPPTRNLADITRPPAGFEPAEPLIAFQDKEVLDSDESIPDLTFVASPETVPDELTTLKQRVQELEELLKEKEALLSELMILSQPKSQETSLDHRDEELSADKVALRTHTVQKGETLSEISRLYYGTRSQWEKIYEANKEHVSDKNHVRVGTVLIIPD